MATYLSGVRRPSGGLTVEAKQRLWLLGDGIVAEFDGWATATALALYHLSDCGRGDVLIVSARPKSWFRLPDGWRLQEPGLLSPKYRCAQALWLGPPEVAPPGSEAVWPCFTDRSKSLPYRDKGPELDPEFPDFSGLSPEHPLRHT